MRKTKIICTLGPASSSEEMVRKLMLAGMDVARFNFSHQGHAEHKKPVSYTHLIAAYRQLMIFCMRLIRCLQHRMNGFLAQGANTAPYPGLRNLQCLQKISLIQNSPDSSSTKST